MMCIVDKEILLLKLCMHYVNLAACGITAWSMKI